MELDTIINIITQYNLTGDELLLIYLTLCAQDGHPEYFAKWFNGGGQAKLKDLFISLKEKGIIHKNYDPSSYIPDEIEFNKTFLKRYFKLAGELGRELFEAYEPFIKVNGALYSLKNYSKKFYSLDEFCFWYSSTIGHSVEKHKKIIEILKWARENNLINIGILEFVSSHKWVDLEKLRLEGFNKQTASSIYLD